MDVCERFIVEYLELPDLVMLVATSQGRRAAFDTPEAWGLIVRALQRTAATHQRRRRGRGTNSAKSIAKELWKHEVQARTRAATVRFVAERRRLATDGLVALVHRAVARHFAAEAAVRARSKAHGRGGMAVAAPAHTCCFRMFKSTAVLKSASSDVPPFAAGLSCSACGEPPLSGRLWRCLVCPTTSTKVGTKGRGRSRSGEACELCGDCHKRRADLHPWSHPFAPLPVLGLHLPVLSRENTFEAICEQCRWGCEIAIAPMKPHEAAAWQRKMAKCTRDLRLLVPIGVQVLRPMPLAMVLWRLQSAGCEAEFEG